MYEVGQVDIAVEQCDDILHGLANHRDKTSVFAAINFWWGKGVAAMPLTPAKYFHDTQSLSSQVPHSRSKWFGEPDIQSLTDATCLLDRIQLPKL